MVDHRRYTDEEMEVWRAIGYKGQQILEVCRVTDEARSYLEHHDQRVPYQGELLWARLVEAGEQLEGETAIIPVVAVFRDELHSQFVRFFMPQAFIHHIKFPEASERRYGEPNPRTAFYEKQATWGEVARLVVLLVKDWLFGTKSPTPSTNSGADARKP